MIIKTLMGSIRQYKKETIFASSLMVLEVITEVLIPFFMASLIDLGIDKGDMNYVTRTGIFLFFLAILSLILGAGSSSYAAVAATGFAANLRKDIFDSVQKFSFSNIDKFSSASLVTRLTTDVSNIQMAYQSIIRMAVRAICMSIFPLVMAFIVNPQVALIFVCVAPILGIGLVFIITRAHPFFLRALKTYDKLNNIVQENLQGIRVVKSYVREEEEIDKFKTVSQEIYNHFSGGQKRVAFNMPLIRISIYVSVLLIGWIGAGQVVANNMTTGDLMSMFAYSTQILMSLMMLSMVLVQIIIARSSALRIVEVLNEESSIRNPQDPIVKVKDGSINFNHVNFSYIDDENKLCLIEANIKIDSGETIGIIGGTGSSKTTFVQLIPRLYDVTTGEVAVGGINVKNYDIESLRNEVAMVLQNNILFSGTIKENLRWGNPNATDEEIKHACSLAQADKFIEDFPDKYDTHIEEGGTNVSGGQRQRLCIARALLKKPKILILDDSTSAVDTKTDASIRKAFKEEIPNTTKLIIAQRISSIIDADRIVIMDRGKIVAIGTHNELLDSNEIYQEVYHTQMQGGGDFDE